MLFTTAGVCNSGCLQQQTAFLAMLSIKLRLVDLMVLTILDLSSLCGRALGFLLHKDVQVVFCTIKIFGFLDSGRYIFSTDIFI